MLERKWEGGEVTDILQFSDLFKEQYAVSQYGTLRNGL